MKSLLVATLATALSLTAHAAAPAAELITPVPPAPEPKPNFLFIAIDGLSPLTGYLAEEPGNFLQTLYPDPGKRAAIKKVLTPNLDRLAAQATVFPRAAAPSTLGNTSRTALLTGIQAHRLTLPSANAGFRQSPTSFVASAVTLPQNLRAHGYYTAGSGKIFPSSSVVLDKATGTITTDWPDTASSWDTWINDHDAPGEGQAVPSRYSSTDPIFRFGALSGSGPQMNDYQRADLLARALTQGTLTVEDIKVKQIKTIDLTQKPFFLACGIAKPQLPWLAPQEFLDQLNPTDIQITREFYDKMVNDLRDLPVPALALTDKARGADAPARGRLQDILAQGKKISGTDGDLAAWRDAVRHYLACIMVADRAVGRLLDALDKSKFQRNTLVILWSDHGTGLGSKYRLGDGALWEDNANCVFLIKDPRYAHIAGQRSYAPVNLIDLYRTVSAAAGVPASDHVAGTNISPLLGDPDRSWRVPSLTTTGAGNHSVTDGRFRYLRYGDNPQTVELYDHQTDPLELTNVAEVKKYSQVRAGFDAALQQVLALEPTPSLPSGKR